MRDKRTKPELLAPAGDMERLKMAVLYGADAVYLAGTDFGMRAFAGNFTPKELPQAVDFARRLYEQGMFDGALRQLARAEQKTEEWYFLNGQILMKMKQYASAHQCFRAAVRFSPENREYRAWALDAALAMKKSQTLSHRVANWAGGLFRRK